MKLINLIKSAFILLLIFSVFISVAFAASFFNENQYDIFLGDYNSDSEEDIYLSPKQKVILIPFLELNIPISTNATLPSYILQKRSDSSGIYDLISDPDQIVLDSVAWTPATFFEFYFGDFDGDGNQDTLLRSTDSDYPSFIFPVDGATNTLTVSQQIAFDDFNEDFSDSEIFIDDFNSDGIDDIRLTNTTTSTSTDLLGSASGQVTEDTTVDPPVDPPPTGNPFNAPSSVNPHALTSGVGAIQGSFSVNSSGKANYSIPLRLPPSVADIAPQLAFTYTGLDSDGMLGAGWYLNGLSSITRCSTTYDQDTYIDGVNFNDSDRYCLNGQRLIAINGTYGQSNTEYRTESESFARIVSFNYSASAKGPAYFVVQHSTGEIETYGNGSNSRQTESTGTFTYAWNISRKEDREGNYVNYTYTSNPSLGEHYLSQIEYTGNTAANLNPQTTLNFVYETRTDVTPSTTNSTLTAYRQRLARVETNISGSKIREYRLNYQYGAATGRSQLNNILDCPFSGSTPHCLPATQFEWEQFANIVSFLNVGEDSDSTRFTAGANINDAQYNLADVNADGRDDIIATYRNGNTLEIILYTANSSGNGFSFESRQPETQFFATTVDDLQQNYYAGDVNGDGRADLVYVARHLSDVYRTIYLANSSGTGFIDQGYQVDTDPQYQGLDLAEFRFGDVNGDGRTDVIWIFGKDNMLGTTVYLANQDNNGNIYLGKTSSEIHNGESGYSPNFYNNNNFLTGDVNGDQKTDLVWVFTLNELIYRVLFLADDNGSKFYNVSAESENDLFTDDDELVNPLFQLGDVNADGKADLVWTAKRGTEISRTTYLSAEAGNRFVRTSNVQDSLGGLTIASHENDALRMADVNSDGQSDLIYTYTTSANQFGWVSLIADKNGLGFSIGDSDQISGANDPGNVNHEYLFGDITSDGRPDMVWLFNNSANSLIKRSYKLPEAYPDHISAITDGFGSQVTINYEYLSDPIANIYTRDNQAQYPEREDSGQSYVVRNIARSNGIGGTRQWNYEYMGARTHLRGRGFLGFQQRKVQNLETNFKTTETYYQNFPLIGQQQSSVTLKNAGTGTPVSKTFSHWKTYNVNWPNATTDTQYPYLQDSVTQSFELNGGAEISTNVIANTYNSITGNLIRTEEATGYGFIGLIDAQYDPEGTFATNQVSNQQLETITMNLYSPADFGANWRPGFLERETVTYNGQNDSNRSLVSIFTPKDNSSYLPATETRLSGTSVQKSFYYTYDNFGNLRTRVTNAVGVPALTDTYGVYTNGLYSESTTNALSHTETYDYDPRTGFKTQVDDANGLKSYAIYDDFGRLVASQTNSGALTQTTYLLCSPSTCSGVPLSRYKTVTTVSHIDETDKGAPDVTRFYDQFDRELRVEQTGFNGETIVVETEYDNRGRVASTTEPHFSGASAPTTTYNYDDYDRITLEDRPDNSEFTYIYSVDSGSANARSKVSETHRVYRGNSLEKSINSSQWSNSLSQTARTEDGEQIPSAFEYDGQGNLIKATVDNNTNTTVTATYDFAGNKTSIDDPSAGTINWAYNGLGRPTLQTYVQAGHTIASVYDNLGRLTTRTDTGTNNQTANWTYDPAFGIGQVHTVSNGSDFNETFSYDYYTRVRFVDTDLQGIDNKRFRYTYDGYDRLATKEFPSQFTVQFGYNSDGYLESKVDANGSNPIWTATAQDARNNYTAYAYGNGVTTNKTYNANNGHLERITANGATTIQDHTNAYDTNGNLYSRAIKRGAITFTENFTYDDIHRLKQSAISGITNPRTTNFDYDELGNIKTKSDVSDTNGYTYPATGRIHGVTQVVKSGEANKVYGYDTKGNLTNRAGQTIDYAVFNKPISIVGQSEFDTSFTTLFKYSPERKRFYQQHTSNGNARTTYYYQDRGFEIVQQDGITREKSFVGDHLVHTNASNLPTDTLRYLHQDHLGSTEAITDDAGIIVAQYGYDTHGRNLTETWDLADASRQNTIVQNSLDATFDGFTNQEFLADSGLIHMNGRVYDPIIGRFLSADPEVQFTFDSQSYNRYAYVRNNPLSYVDPTGEILFIPIALIIIKAVDIGLTVYETNKNLNTLADTNSTDSQISAAKKDLAITAGSSFVPGAKTTASIYKGGKKLLNGKKANTGKVKNQAEPNSKGTDSSTQKSTENRGGGDSKNTGKNSQNGDSGKTQRAAMREAKRKEGIPTSQQADSQISAKVGDEKIGRQQTFEVPKKGGGTESKSVQISRDIQGKHAGKSTVEAGSVKTDPLTGEIRNDIAGRPKLKNNKTRIEF